MMRAQRPGMVELLTAIGLIAVPLVLPYLGSAPNTVNRILVWGLFGIGFDILFGYTGLLSFGQSALYGTGGFIAAYLLTRAGFPYVILALIIGMVAAAVVRGAVLARPSGTGASDTWPPGVVEADVEPLGDASVDDDRPAHRTTPPGSRGLFRGRRRPDHHGDERVGCGRTVMVAEPAGSS